MDMWKLFQNPRSASQKLFQNLNHAIQPFLKKKKDSDHLVSNMKAERPQVMLGSTFFPL